MSRAFEMIEIRHSRWLIAAVAAGEPAPTAGARSKRQPARRPGGFWRDETARDESTAGARSSGPAALGTEIAGRTFWRCLAPWGRRVSDRDQRCRLDSFDQRPRLQMRVERIV